MGKLYPYLPYGTMIINKSQAGTIAYCGIMEATMANSGGKHAWDITRDEAQSAAYVRPPATS
jgi:hypothetical protein